MDWIGCLLKLCSWTLLSGKNRYGFAFGIVGNVVIGYASYNAGLYGITAYSAMVSLIQIRGWRKWHTTKTQS